MLKFYHKLEKEEKITFLLHLVYSAVDGIIRGMLALNEFIFIKSLKGSSYQVSFLFQASVVVLLLSIFFNQVLYRSKNKKRLLRRAGYLTHLPLLILFFFPHSPEFYTVNSIYHYIFLFVFFAYYTSYPIVFPSINLFLKNKYSSDNFGKLYSIATSFRQILWLIATFFFGLFLDMNNYSFSIIYPILGVLGMFGLYMFSRINYEPSTLKAYTKGIWGTTVDSLKKIVKILKTNRPYFDFQLGFMLYGFAFMSTKAVIIIFYYEELALNYSSVAFYQNAYNILAIILLPVFGRVIGNVEPRKFLILTFVFMAGYLLFVTLTQYFTGSFLIWEIQVYYALLISVIFYGLFAATMSLSWSIGSSYFCSNEEAADYQSIHVSLTGVRGAVSPLIGVAVYEFFGFTMTFGIAISALILAIGLMIYSTRRFPVIKSNT